MTDQLDSFTLEKRSKYEMLCRGETGMTVREISKLKCRYTHKNNPFLLIAPLKEEDAYLNPRILLYRKIIYPNEIEIIKNKAKPRVRINFLN